MPIEAAMQLCKDAAGMLGCAAELACLTRREFEAVLADRGIEWVVACDVAFVLRGVPTGMRRTSAVLNVWDGQACCACLLIAGIMDYDVISLCVRQHASCGSAAVE